MKAKFLLFTFIIGIIWFDISCGGHCEGNLLEVIGIKKIELKEIIWTGKTIPLVNDSIAFNSLLFVVNFEERVIASNNNFSFINMAYATEPCEPPHTDWELDSIKIFTFVNTIKTDVTNHFSLANNKIDNSDENFMSQLRIILRNSPVQMEFKLITPPIKTDTFQFNFQFFDKKGRRFEKMNSPVIITP